MSILVRFEIQRRSKFDIFTIKIDHFRSIFDLNRSLLIYFWLKYGKRPSKCRVFNQKPRYTLKTTNYIKNDDQKHENPFIFDYFRLNSIYFWLKSNYFRNKWSGFESLQRFQLNPATISNWKVDLKSIRIRLKTNFSWESIRLD